MQGIGLGSQALKYQDDLYLYFNLSQTENAALESKFLFCFKEVHIDTKFKEIVLHSFEVKYLQQVSNEAQKWATLINGSLQSSVSIKYETVKVNGTEIIIINQSEAFYQIVTFASVIKTQINTNKLLKQMPEFLLYLQAIQPRLDKMQIIYFEKVMFKLKKDSFAISDTTAKIQPLTVNAGIHRLNNTATNFKVFTYEEFAIEGSEKDLNTTISAEIKKKYQEKFGSLAQKVTLIDLIKSLL